MRVGPAASLLFCTLLVACGNNTPALVPQAGGPAATGTAAAAAPPSSAPLRVGFDLVTSGFTRPTFVTAAGDGSGRLFVVEKAGLIRIVTGGAISTEPFADLRSLVTATGNEQGLLGLAFHPRFKDNGRLFVTYTAANGGANTLAELRALDGKRVDATSPRVLLAIPDTRPNHNGGMVAFGPDGYLYLSTGDGGGAGDPDRSAQDPSNLLGKILRLDIDGDGVAPYAVPPSNPFAGKAGARGEVWALGLRNPWRFSFDRATGDLWIGDVGQNRREEIDLQPAASRGGENYGWSVIEGSACFRPETACSSAGFTAPVAEYDHEDGACSVTGGYVYRGKLAPGLIGRYLFTDYCQTVLRTLRPEGSRFAADDAGLTPGSVSSFGEDEAGELYLVSDRDGGLYRLVAR